MSVDIKFPIFPNFLIFPGVIRTALANMDREVKAEYHVLLQAKDMAGQLGALASTTTINITLSDVNDNPPRFPQSKKVSAIATFQHNHGGAEDRTGDPSEQPL